MRLIFTLLLIACGRHATGQRFNAPALHGTYHVALQRNGSPVCGGSIVDERWILTAASCQQLLPLENATALVGLSKSNEAVRSYVIDRFIPHSRYNRMQFRLSPNIALARLKVPLSDSSFAKKIEYYDRDVPLDAIVTLVDYRHATWTSTNVQTISINECMSLYNRTRLNPIVDVGNLCTVNRVDAGAATGTTGSGLSWEGKLIGVFENVLPHLHKYPNTNARVSYYHDWIRTTIAQNSDGKSIAA